VSGASFESVNPEQRSKDWSTTTMKNMPKHPLSKERGFTLIELVVVLAVSLVVAGMAIPNFMSALRLTRLKGAVSDFAGLLQSARIKAVADDRYYSVYVLGGTAPEAFVDIYPQQASGASGSGGTQPDPQDPVIGINSEVVQKPVGSAPNTASLQALFLPANATVVLGDGSVAASAITYGPRGLPCSASALTCKTRLPAGDIAYWIFFQDVNSTNWGAVTVTPAGRIQRWLFTGGATGTWAKY
jgi:prepilin-type N-terminal cleavage/methylation domain-containing protein